MKQISTNIKGDIVKKMFPYQMKVWYEKTWIDESLPPSQQVEQTETFLIGDVPCSVQSATSSVGEVIENEYIILSPCLDFSNILNSEGIPNDSQKYKLEIAMNGRTNKAAGIDILSIDNTQVYRIGNLPIGCKIKVHKTGENWSW